jgi:hypothetical protein
MIKTAVSKVVFIAVSKVSHDSRISKTAALILIIVLLTICNISIGDILVYKCVVDNVPTFQNIPCLQPDAAQDLNSVMHLRSDRNVIKSLGAVQHRQEKSTAYSISEPDEYTQTYGEPEDTSPTPTELFPAPAGQHNNRQEIFHRYGKQRYPGVENTNRPTNRPTTGPTTKHRRRFQGKELEFKELKPRELEFRTVEPKALQYKELQFRQVRPRQVQSRGIGSRTVQSKGIRPRNPQPSVIEPLLDTGERTPASTDTGIENRP